MRPETGLSTAITAARMLPRPLPPPRRRHELLEARLSVPRARSGAAGRRRRSLAKRLSGAAGRRASSSFGAGVEHAHYGVSTRVFHRRTLTYRYIFNASHAPAVLCGT